MGIIVIVQFKDLYMLYMIYLFVRFCIKNHLFKNIISKSLIFAINCSAVLTALQLVNRAYHIIVLAYRGTKPK